MTLPQGILDALHKIGFDVSGINPVSGGDINRACLIKAQENSTYFIKYNDLPSSEDNLREEAYSLRKLKDVDVIPVPDVIHVDKIDGSDMAFLILEYIPEEGKEPPDMRTFGEQLSMLHNMSNSTFGWPSNNYIGSLPQYNNEESSWSTFYATQRLLPQIEMAKKKGLIPGDLDVDLKILIGNLPSILPATKPQLIHGDLWSGNYYNGPNGTVYLIDPSCSYAKGEMDLAMSLLFGGFSEAFYDAYEQQGIVHRDWRSRVPLYQLYYLLVHVNLFGSSYLPGVMRAVRRYV